MKVFCLDIFNHFMIPEGGINNSNKYISPIPISGNDIIFKIIMTNNKIYTKM